MTLHFGISSEQRRSIIVTETAAKWNDGDRTMADIAREFAVTTQAIQRRLYAARDLGLLTRELPGGDYRTNRPKYNAMNRKGYKRDGRGGKRIEG